MVELIVQHRAEYEEEYPDSDQLTTEFPHSRVTAPSGPREEPARQPSSHDQGLRTRNPHTSTDELLAAVSNSDLPLDEEGLRTPGSEDPGFPFYSADTDPPPPAKRTRFQTGSSFSVEELREMLYDREHDLDTVAQEDTLEDAPPRRSHSEPHPLCEYPDCPRPAEVDQDGAFTPYCSLLHMQLAERLGAPASTSGSRLCALPGCSTRTWVQPDGEEFDFCSRRHADEGMTMGFYPLPRI